jgi:hypothetical protein
MTYDQFKVEYVRLYNIMWEYTPDQVGSTVYCEKLATLADQYPEFEEQLLNEDEQDGGTK